MSPSLRGRGLKSDAKSAFYVLNYVALFTRAWIEIFSKICEPLLTLVALFTRAWIEMPTFTQTLSLSICRPLYEGVD